MRKLICVCLPRIASLDAYFCPNNLLFRLQILQYVLLFANIQFLTTSNSDSIS